MIDKIFEHNKQFVSSGAYKAYATDKFPDKKVAILTCMDARLIELLPSALGFKNGDVKIIKNAGGIISHPYGSVTRSILVAIYQLGVDTIWVIGHSDCGMNHMEAETLLESMRQRGISQELLDDISAKENINYNSWLGGFPCVNDAVKSSMSVIKTHPLIPKDITVEGLIVNPKTGELTHVL